MTKNELEGLSSSEMVALYNKLNPKYPVKKFESRQKAMDRILTFSQATGKAADVPKAKPTEANAPKQPKAPKEPKQKKVGIISTLNAFCLNSKHSFEEIVAHLTTSFPDKKADSMANTVRANMKFKEPNNLKVSWKKEKIEGKGLVYACFVK